MYIYGAGRSKSREEKTKAGQDIYVDVWVCERTGRSLGVLKL